MTDAQSQLGELLKRAMGRQRIGAAESLDELITNLTGSDPAVAYRRPERVGWRDPDEAELQLRRFLQDFTA